MYVSTDSVLDSSELFSKLRLITLSDENLDVTSDVHPRISATGRVASNDNHAPAFRMNILQTLSPGSYHSSISLRGLLPTHTACRRLFRRVPLPGAFLTFTGVILALHSKVPTVGVEEFTVLPSPDAKTLEDID